MNKMKIDCPLIVLAYIYLEKKSRVTHKKYTLVDLLETCERILQYSEQTNRFQKLPKIKFIADGLEADEKILNLHHACV